MAKIIVADDEKRIRDLLSEFLTDEGFTVLTAADGREAIDLYSANPDADLIVLDVMMPDIDGWRACKEIRRVSQVPIIMLTAKSGENDELESFDRGANDYITKPFSLAVLLARINARIVGKKQEQAPSGALITHGDLFINLETHEVELKGTVMDLTPIEYEVLVLLSKNRGKVFTREQLLMHIWGYEYYGGDRTVDTHVGRLRLKLGEYGEQYIKTVRGYGYKFDVK